MSKATILAVDDEPDILIALEDLFEDEYRVLTTSRPAEALEILAAEPDIAVIVSDQRMPGMTGDAMLAQARGLHDAQAILLTGYADMSAVISALNQGGITGYATKPWDADLLRGAVRQAYERHRLGRELATERALLMGLLDHSEDAISFKDGQGRFVRLNARKAERLGRTTAECLGRTEAALRDDPASTDHAGTETDGAAEADAQAIAAGRPTETEITEGPEGAERWSHVARVPIRGASGAVVHLATIERDVTEHRLLEARLRQSDKMQALGTLAGGIAHDFNNLLTAILGSLELATPKIADQPRVLRLVTNATQAAQRGATLTKRLLGFSRSRDLRPRAVDLNHVIAGMGELLGGSLGGLVGLTLRLDPAAPAARVDPDQLELAVLNLCINSRDAMPEGGSITVSTRILALRDDPDLPDGDYAAIEVADTGTGIPPAILQRVCEPFFTTKAVGQGTGLGLAMVFGLAQQSAGRLRIASEVGEGTRVELLLPRTEAEIVGEAAPEPAPAAPVQAARILVVDDDPEVRHVTASFLATFGYAESEASDGPSAVTLLERDRFDLVVADLAMPGMTGVELAAIVRARWAGVPVLILTGHAEAIPIPADLPVLRKPFESGDLAAEVSRLLVPGP
ncbi:MULTISPECIES: response regulator [unclassified Methylobacterium]|uniref:response regulator n=1 Tax=unclassified Methylobacterium TaxID=2615210 RepID=UPI0006FC2F85|nr:MULTISPECIES: response regulator [unclassified Methylobacterium]KQO72092.1 histidine kinase [Methylobacterium sp. Leaf87]KQP29004.1 histidine kinase [Methylobacterium sp. Leaf100]